MAENIEVKLARLDARLKAHGDQGLADRESIINLRTDIELLRRALEARAAEVDQLNAELVKEQSLVRILKHNNTQLESTVANTKSASGALDDVDCFYANAIVSFVPNGTFINMLQGCYDAGYSDTDYEVLVAEAAAVSGEVKKLRYQRLAEAYRLANKYDRTVIKAAFDQLFANKA